MGKFVAKDVDGSTSNNLFNIKTGTHNEFDSIKINTTEYITDTPIKIVRSSENIHRLNIVSMITSL